jgi:transposase
MLQTLGDGDILLANRAYDSDVLGTEMAARGAWANIRFVEHRRRRPTVSAFLYKYSNPAERLFKRLKHFRAAATRYDKRDDHLLASVQLASIRIWLRHNKSMS